MPKLGESITEATILKWHKNPGDKVKMDETVLDIATDKVDSEVPSTAAGVIEEILFNVNDVVPIGTVIAKIKTEGTNTVTEIKTPATYVKEQTVIETMQPAVHEKANIGGTVTNTSTNSNRFYSPLVLNIAGSEGISMMELEKIAGK